MKILVAPLHYIIDPDEGSEYTRAYEYLTYLAKDKKLLGDVLVGFCNENKIGNFKIHKMFNKKPAYISNLIRLRFIFWVFKKSLSLMKENDYSLIWHHGPFAIDETFSLLALINRKKVPFLLGPVFSPIPVVGKSDFGLFGKKVALKPSLLIKNKIESFIYKYFAKSFSYLSFLTLKNTSIILNQDIVGKNIINKKGILNTEVLTLSVIAKNFLQKHKNLLKKQFTLLSVGYFIERKRTVDLIEAINILINTYKIKNIKLILIGDGSQRKNLESLTSKYNLEKFVHFEGFIPRTKLARYYKNADIFLSASIADIMPGMYFEAMCASLPMVLAKNSTSDELKAKKFGGYVVEPNNPELIAKSVSKLVKNKKIIYEYGQRNFELMQNDYNFEKNIQRLKNIFFTLSQVHI